MEDVIETKIPPVPPRREDPNVYLTTDHTNRHNEFGHEILNPTPMQPPLGYKPVPSLLDTIREQIRAHHLSTIDMDPETEEEADDFDIPDDPIDPQSRWENDTIPSVKEMRARRERLEEELRNLEAQTQTPPGGRQAADPPLEAPADE